jgi:hypothetical protein
MPNVSNFMAIAAQLKGKVFYLVLNLQFQLFVNVFDAIKWRHDTQHNNTQPNDIQFNGIQHNNK